MPKGEKNSIPVPEDLKEDFLALVDSEDAISDFLRKHKFNRNTLRSIRNGLNVHPDTISKMKRIRKQATKKTAA